MTIMIPLMGLMLLVPDWTDGQQAGAAPAKEVPTPRKTSLTVRGLWGLAAVVLFALLLLHVDPFALDSSRPGRENSWQCWMAFTRCAVLPIVLVSRLRYQKPDEASDRRGRLVSTVVTTLWPRARDAWGWCPTVLLGLNRAGFGFADALERGKFDRKDPWACCWRLWQHLACVVSVCIGFCYFHAEKGRGRWRPLRQPHGCASPEMLQLLPSWRMLALLALLTLADAFTDTAALPPASTVTGFWRQVLRGFFNPVEEPLAAAAWGLLLLTLACKLLRLQQAGRCGTALLEGIFSYLVLCAQHRMAELTLMVVVMFECDDMAQNIKAWSATYVRAEREVVVGPAEAEQLKDSLKVDDDSVITEVPLGAATLQADGVHAGMKLIKPHRGAATAEEWERLVVAADPLPKGAEASLIALRREVKQRGRNICCVIHYLILERVMYFLTDFSQDHTVGTLVVRHVAYTLVGGRMLLRITALNYTGSRYLEQQLAEAELRPSLDMSQRDRVRSFRSLVAEAPGRMGIRVFDMRLTWKHLSSAALVLAVYAKLGKRVLQFVGLDALFER